VIHLSDYQVAFQECERLEARRLSFRERIDLIKPVLESLKNSESQVLEQANERKAELKELQKVQWDAMHAKDRCEKEIKQIEMDIMKANLNIQQANDDLDDRKPAAVDWTKNDVATLKNHVVELLRGWLKRPSLTLDDLTTAFLYSKCKLVKLKELWTIMQKEKFALNPHCPFELKDQRPGCEGKLIGVSDTSKLDIVQKIKSALDIPEPEDEEE
jgi:hypothetical protein